MVVSKMKQKKPRDAWNEIQHSLVGVVFCAEVEQYGATFEDSFLLGLAVCSWGAIDDCRYPPVGIDSEKPVFLLLIFADMDLVRLVLESQLFQSHASLLSIRCTRGVQDNVSLGRI